MPMLFRSAFRLPKTQRPLSHKPASHNPTRIPAVLLMSLTFVSAAHAQGTMDFTGAQTLMTTFKTFAIYAGAVICFGGLIFAGIRMLSDAFRTPFPVSSARSLALECWAGAPDGLARSPAKQCSRWRP